MKRFLSIVLLGMLIFSLTACTGSDYVAKVNDEVITREDFDTAVEQVTAAQGIDLEDPQLAPMRDSLELQILDQMIEEELLMQEAERLDMEADPELVEEQFAQVKGQFESDEEFNEFYKDQFKDPEKEIKEELADMLTKQALFEEITKDVKVTTDSEEYYEENKEQMLEPEQVKATHVLVETQEEAESIIKDLKENDGDIGEIALEKSIDPTAKQNKGNLDYFPKGSMVPEFEEAAFALEVGEISSEPVQTEHGYHVIFVEDKKEEKELSFDESKDQIEQALLNEAREEKIIEFISELREEAEIENKLEEEVLEKTEKQEEELQEAPAEDEKQDDEKADDKKADEAGTKEEKE